MTVFSDLTTLLGDSSDDWLGFLTSALAGVATALAVAIALTVYFRTGYRTGRDVLRHGLVTLGAVALLAFVAHDMHHAALAYLGLDPSKPAVEFEIRVPSEELTAVSDSQIERHTDRKPIRDLML
jgi:hypothetical protein